MSKSHRPWIIVALVILLATGCQTAQEQATPTPIPTPIVAEKATYTVQRGRVKDIQEFNARISPVNEEELFFQEGGYISAVNVERNEFVQAGDVIAELEQENALNQLAQAKVNLEKAVLNLEKAQESNSRNLAESEASLEIKELRLEKMRLQRPDIAVQIAEKRLEAAEAKRQAAQAAYDRVSWKPGAEATNAAQALQSATIDYEIAQANYQSALRSLETYQKDLAVMEKEYELAKLQHSYLAEGVDPGLEKAVEQAQLNVERLEGQVNKGRLISPIDGIVSSLAIAEGRTADAFRTAAIVANTDELELAAQLSDAEMQDLEVGMPVTVTLGLYPGQVFEGTITEMPYPYGQGGSTEKLDKADQFTHIDLADKDVELRMGDVAKIMVLLAQSDGTLYLPPAAVRNFEGRYFVVAESEGRQRRIDVTVGIIGKNRIEILEGLEQGDVVVGQ
jgi:multidrug efflux pump subunit AcrA (membrane-fusion protein)